MPLLRCSSALLHLLLLLLLCCSISAASDDNSGSSEESKEKKDKGSAAAITCVHNNVTYASGEHIPTPEKVCLHCTCVAGWTGPSHNYCAVIDCPFGYYRSRPNCNTEYVAGRCCPELKCGPMNPQVERTVLASKKPRTSTEQMIITSAPRRDITFYCIADDVTDGKPDTARWSRTLSDGKEVDVELSSKVVAGFFPPNTWALYLDEIKDGDDGDYNCYLDGEQPPRKHTTTLKIDVRPARKHPSCTAATTLSLPPGEYDCDDFPTGYYYNATLLNCEPYDTATMGRLCRKPDNYFATRQECWAQCADACYADRDEGACEVRTTRYHYDHSSDQCRGFVYGGCGGNRNNFRTREECEDACASVKFRMMAPDISGKVIGSDDNADEAAATTPPTTPPPPPPPCGDSSCPWSRWQHYLWKGCVAVTEVSSCCPTRFECPDVPVHTKVNESRNLGAYHCDASHHHVDADKTLFPMRDPHECLNCSCSADDDHEFRCLSRCEYSAERLDQGCVPIYDENDCCPKDWHCPSKSKYRQRGPEEHFKEPLELRCTFGGRDYARNYELIVADPCLTCTCLTPPDFTCSRHKCPPHPSQVDATKRCAVVPQFSSGRTCCPVYDCWDIIKEPNRVGYPQTPKEFAVCNANPCDTYQTCLVNFTECHRNPATCKPTCEICATPLCSAGGYLQQIPHNCPVCSSYSTPEDVCEHSSRMCGDNVECTVVDEDTCRQRGRCEAACIVRLDMKQVVVADSSVQAMTRSDCALADCGPTCEEVPASVEGGCHSCKCPLTDHDHGADDHHVALPPPEKIPCMTVSCASPCKAEPPGEDGCSKSCICPKTAEEACKNYSCTDDGKCIADCDDWRCTPSCLVCLQVKCGPGCSSEKDEHGCDTPCECKA